MRSMHFFGAPTNEDLKDPNWRPPKMQRYIHTIPRPAPTPSIVVKTEPDSQPLARFQTQPTPSYQRLRLDESYGDSYAGTQAPAAALPHHWRFKSFNITELNQLRSKLEPSPFVKAEVEMLGYVLDLTPAKTVRTADGKETMVMDVKLGDTTGATIKLTFWGDACRSVNDRRITRFDIVYFRRISVSLERNVQPEMAAVVGTSPWNFTYDDDSMQICWSATDRSNQPLLRAAHISPEENRVAQIRQYMEDNDMF